MQRLFCQKDLVCVNADLLLALALVLKLNGSVNGRNQLLLDHGKMIVEGCAQFFLQLFADVGHFIGGDAAVELLKNLLCAIGRLPILCAERPDLLGSH